MRRAIPLALSLLVGGCSFDSGGVSGTSSAPANGPTAVSQPSTLFRPGVFTFRLDPIVSPSAQEPFTCEAYVGISPLLVTDSVNVYVGPNGGWLIEPTSRLGGDAAIAVVATAASRAPDSTIALGAQITGTIIDMDGPVPSDSVVHDVTANFPIEFAAATLLSGTVSADGRSASGTVMGPVVFAVASKHESIHCINANSVRWTLQAVSPAP
jgi:hypothetical protein